MKTHFLLALAAALPSLTLAAPDPAKLRDAALADTLAYDIVEGLTTEVGQRLAGTEAEARARDWAVARLKRLGFANVRVEPFDMPVWVRGLETGEIVAPFPQKLVLTALGNSGATPPGGLTGEIVAFDTIDAFRVADPAKVRGRIVFVDHRMTRTQDGSSYGAFGGARRLGPSLASKMGALAIVIRSIGSDRSRAPHTGVQAWDAGVTPIPAVALSVIDAEQLARILKRGKPVTMKLVVTPQQIGTRQSGNVIADVPGTDARAGLVAIGCHLDSWDLGTGAFDDAAGCAITAAAAKQILDAGERPKRTIRLIWFGAEEVGLLGGIAYRDRHKDERHALVAESDFGADRVWRVDYSLPVAAEPVQGTPQRRACAARDRARSRSGERRPRFRPARRDGRDRAQSPAGRDALFRPASHARGHARQD